MPTVVNLDDRRWSDLADEGRALLPVHAPVWTDHNAHDPGITLLELFAAITDMDVFRIAQMPEERRLLLLALVGVRPEPARPASLPIEFTRPAAHVFVPRSSRLVEASGGDPKAYRSAHAVHLVPASIASLAVAEPGALPTPVPMDTGLAPFGDEAAVGTELYVGLAGEPPAGIPLTLVAVARDERPGDREAWQRFATLACAPCRAPDSLTHCDGDEEPESSGPAAPPPVELEWEFSTDAGWRPLPAAAVHDETRAFTFSGRVVLTLPEPPARRQLGHDAEPRTYLRCRIARGRYDCAPRLSAFALNGAFARQVDAPGSVALRLVENLGVEGPAPAAGSVESLSLRFDTKGAVDHIGRDPQDAERFSIVGYRPPAPGAPGELRVDGLRVALSDGTPNQCHALPEWVADDGIRVFTREGSRLKRWSPRPSLRASRAADSDFALRRNEIHFGDGMRGRVPPRRSEILAFYERTAGSRGDLAAGAPLAGDGGAPGARVLPHPATGQDPESFGDTVLRAAEQASRSDRVVAAADHEERALSTPGTWLRRAHALPSVHPAFDCAVAPGVTTLVILPCLPSARPEPTPATVRAVAAHLAPQRLLGTRIEVTGPSYLEVAVSARLFACTGSDPARIESDALAALHRFLSPLEGGDDGEGWPLGRDVVRSEVLTELSRIPGVEHVQELAFLARGERVCGNVCLGRLELPASGDHRVAVEVGR